ncbi:hypothetical protein [Streptomyces sp. NPDC127033]|uniref:hypothetical protein n=1 Tax=Streptomyces sp. NPDC127033 TaxID=3347110 RepID=UPI00365483E5
MGEGPESAALGVAGQLEIHPVTGGLHDLCGLVGEEDKGVALRRAAEFTDGPTRHAAAAALALAGSFSGEIGHTGPTISTHLTGVCGCTARPRSGHAGVRWTTRACASWTPAPPTKTSTAVATTANPASHNSTAPSGTDA